MSASRNSRSNTARIGPASANNGKSWFIGGRSSGRVAPGGFRFVEIVWQIGRMELAFDLPVAAKQAAMRDFVPFRDQMRGHEHALAAPGFEAQRFLKSFAPARIET